MSETQKVKCWDAVSGPSPWCLGEPFPYSTQEGWSVYKEQTRVKGKGITLSLLFTYLFGLCDGFTIHYFILRSIFLSLKNITWTEQHLHNYNLNFYMT